MNLHINFGKLAICTVKILLICEQTCFITPREKYPEESNIKNEDWFISVQSSRIHHGRKSKAEGGGSSWVHFICNQEDSKVGLWTVDIVPLK